MAVISMFYGMIIYLFFEDNKQHHLPHIHVKYQDENAVFSIPDGNLLEGGLKPNKICIGMDGNSCRRIISRLGLAINGQKVFKIDLLK
jgi:hypothetical protein